MNDAADHHKNAAGVSSGGTLHSGILSLTKSHKIDNNNVVVGANLITSNSSSASASASISSSTSTSAINSINAAAAVAVNYPGLYKPHLQVV